MPRACTLALAAVLPFQSTHALRAQDPELLAKQSLERCVATARERPTPAWVVAQAREAAALLAKEGKAALAKFRGKDTPFILHGTYITIHDPQGVVQMHPLKPSLEGRSLLTLKDANGKAFIAEMNQVAAKGGGWVDYQWPRPGETGPAPKVSYALQARHGAELYIVGCGLYDMTLDAVLKSGAK